jgi:glycosyltransferase involved in cell wall biosynthesis
MKKIGLLTALDPLDKTSWSGIYYKIYETLKNEGFNVEILGPYPKNKNAERIIYIIEVILKLFTKKRYYHHGTIVNSIFRGLYFSKKIKSSNCDIVLGITSATEFAFLKTTKPLIYFTDSSFGQISKYYSIFSDISSISMLEANFLEKRTCKKVKYVIYPSNWAKDYCVNNYKIDAEKIKVFKMGSNIDFPDTLKTFKTLNETSVRFLFLGVDWERKGGGIVIDALKMIKKKGVNVHLTVCGCSPKLNEDFVKIIPFLNKNNKEDYIKLQNLLIESHFLFLPTQAECYGIVFAEAAAYGLPCIAMNTGGVSSVVKDGESGYVLPENSVIDDYVEKLEYLINNPSKYEEMSLKSRRFFDDELDWKNFGDNFKKLITNF